MLVLDATPLIYLAKAGREDLLGHIPADLVIPGSVYREVVEEGRERGEPDATRIENLVDEGTLAVVDPPSTDLADDLTGNEQLHEAERDVLVLAHHHGGEAILDERYGRKVADVEGIDHGGTLRLLFALVDEGSLRPEEVRSIVDAMVETGWYYSTDLYADILEAIEALE